MSQSHTALGPYHYLSAFIPSVYLPQRSLLIFFLPLYNPVARHAGKLLNIPGAES